MSDTFDFKKFLVENKMTRNSQNLTEEPVKLGPGEAPSGQGDNPAFIKKAKHPVKFAFSDEKGEEGRFYMPYVGKLKEIGVEDAVVVAEIIALKVLSSLKSHADRIYPGSVTGFREELMLPAVKEGLKLVQVSNINDVSAGYIARHIFQAMEEAGMVEVIGGRKSNSGKPREGIALTGDALRAAVQGVKEQALIDAKKYKKG